MMTMNSKYLNWLIERDLDDGLRRRYPEATNFPVVMANVEKGEAALCWAADDATGVNRWQTLKVSLRGVNAAYEVLDRIHRLLDSEYAEESPIVRLDMVRRPFQMPARERLDNTKKS